ncbi:MFS general substrate transporter [Podospora aff. communis PSN243]|uniref:MFS general substrate transporter n=1 Tax=Podospora aff. communis PSN243 TaxID=3040156 RepID=A0AAV9GG17_9PEZI|nr:MFS general substrate transporter [Podospora aff. communis PSN243]
MHSAVTIPQSPRPLRERIHEVLFVLVLCLGQFLSLAGMMQTISSMLILANYFDIRDHGNLSWFSAAYSMTLGTFILPAGRIGDMYGHKRILTFGWAWIALWSLLSSLCARHQLLLFTIFRALQGIGPALIVPNSIGLIGRTLPVGPKRNLAFACFSASGPTGAAVGAIMSALVSSTLSWQWTFRFLALACALLIPISHFTIPSPSPSTTPPTTTPKFDYPSTLTGITALLLINFSLNQAPIAGWSTPCIPSLLLLGLLLLYLFLYLSLHHSSHPLLPLHSLTFRSGLTLLCLFLSWSSHGIWIYYLFLLLLSLRSQPALLSSVQLSSVAITGTLSALLAAYLLRRVPVSYIMFSGSIFFAVGNILLAAAPLEQTYWGCIFFSVVLMPGGMNLSFPAATALLSEAMPRGEQGVAASLVATVMNYSVSVGLGLAGSVHVVAVGWAREQRGLGMAELGLGLVGGGKELVEVGLVGLRAAVWFGAALAGLGLMVAGGFVLVESFGRWGEIRGRKGSEEGIDVVDPTTKKGDLEDGVSVEAVVSEAGLGLTPAAFRISDGFIEDMKQHKFSVTVSP